MIDMLKVQRKYSSNGILLAIIFLITVISQYPSFVEKGQSSIISTIVWSIYAIYFLIVSKNKIPRFIIFPLLFGIFLYIVSVLFHVICGYGYFVKILRNLLLSIFILFCGCLSSDFISLDDIKLSNYSYVISTLVVSINIYLRFFLHKSLSGRIYLYASKNSISLIVLTAIIILLIYYPNLKNNRDRIIHISLIVFFLYFSLILKCRTVIFTIPVVFIINFVFYSKKVFSNRALILLLCAIAIILLSSNYILNIFFQDIIYAGRGTTLAESTSGRVEEWKYFLYEMKGKWLMGDGYSKRESLILTAIMQYGIFVGLLIIFYSWWPLKYLLSTKIYKGEQGFCLTLIAVAYIMNSLGEQLSPFGPGARCFYLWFMFGIYGTNHKLCIEEIKK